MSNTPSIAGVEFPGRDPAETLQFYFRQHWIRLGRPFLHVLPWVLFCIVGLQLLISMPDAGDSRFRHAGLIGIAVIFILTQLEFLAKFYRYFLYVIVVTDKKVHRIKKTLVTVDDHQSIDLWVLQDIHKRQHGIIQNLLGFGTLILDANQTELRIHFVPVIGKKYEVLMHLREQARALMLDHVGQRLEELTRLSFGRYTEEA